MSSIPSVASFVDIFIAVLPAGGAYTLQLLYLLPKQAVIRTEKFQEDMLQNLASEAMSHSVDHFPQAALYGMSQSIPDKGLVKEMTARFLDALYSTKGLSSSGD